jgi:hypothetical protein
VARKEENKMLIPPDGGEWTFVMITGKTYYGSILQRFDDGVVIDCGNDIVAALRTEHIESMWQGLAAPEDYKKSET